MATRKVPHLAGKDDQDLKEKEILTHVESVVAYNQVQTATRDKALLWETFGACARGALWQMLVAALDDAS